jgi:hypothetical protein
MVATWGLGARDWRVPAVPPLAIPKQGLCIAA